jgi:hypothetical protein
VQRERAAAHRALLEMNLALLDVVRFNPRQVRVGKGHRFGGRWAKRLLGDSTATGGSSHVVGDAPLSGGHTGRTSLVTYADGRKRVRKAFVDYHTSGTTIDVMHQADATELTALLGHATGANIPPVRRETPDVVSMVHVDGRLGATLDLDEYRAARDSRQGQLLGLVHLATANYDAGELNWAIDDTGEPWGFDNSFVWLPSDMTDPDQPGHESPFADQFGTPGTGWKTHGISAAELAGIRERWEALRPEFEQRGRGEWLDFALARLAQVEAHSSDARLAAA